MKNNFFKIAITSAVVLSAFGACKKSAFVEQNINPGTLYSVKPEDQFFAAVTGMEDDFEAYYDNYRRIMWWMQLSTDTRGNRKNFTKDASNFNTRYGKIFYGRVGPRLADIPHLVSLMPAAEQGAYVYEQSIAQIFMAYYAFYVSDINGSIPYKDAFQGRYGGTLTPAYDSQDQLFATLDDQLKQAVTTLKTTQSVPQKAFGNSDQFYQGVESKWVKAANALRLRIALRLTKVDNNRTKTIAADVLSDPSSLMTSNDDGWIFYAPSTFGSGGNWSSIGFRAPKPTVDFMKANSDPRLRLFYSKNLEGEYVGSYTNPDTVTAHAAFYDRGDTAVSNIQQRLFDASSPDASANVGDGVNFYPLITFADFCFMRAELAARGLTTEDAAAMYTLGVTSSIEYYDERASAAKLFDYSSATAVTPVEITNYLALPGIAYNPAKGLEQIICQAYIDNYKNPNEAWALFKRTGMPNSTTVLSLPVLTSDGAVNEIPRRAPLGLPVATDANYDNRKAAYDQMAQDPGFGQDPNDAFGRVWWDKP